jgi:hypothetical protein
VTVHALVPLGLAMLAGMVAARLPHALLHELGHFVACRLLAPRSPIQIACHEGWLVTRPRIGAPDASDRAFATFAMIAAAGPLASAAWFGSVLWLLLHDAHGLLVPGLLIGALAEASLTVVDALAAGEDLDQIRAALRQRRAAAAGSA